TANCYVKQKENIKKMKEKIIVQNYRRSSIILTFIVWALYFCGQDVTIAQETVTISINDLRQHMDSIASDATEGRFTGSHGYRKAAQYAADLFREAGLNSGFTNEKCEKSWFQPVPFIRNNYSSASITMRKNGKKRTYAHSAGNFVILNHGIQKKNVKMASPAFVGYGINEPDHGWDDYAGVNVKGRWVILLNGIPPADANNQTFSDSLRELYSDWKTHDSLKLAALTRHEAAGLIVMPDKYATENWERTVLSNYRYNYIHYAEDSINKKTESEPVLPVILVHPELAQILFTGQNYNPVTSKGNYHPYVLENAEIKVTIDCKKEFIDCYNVIAVVPGTDSVLRNEYITVGAHLDHLGKIGNHIYNGANDDASGSVIILEAAKSIALNPPERSVLFVLYTSEEQHLTGSRHFLKNPLVSIEQVSLNINLEQIGSKNRDFPGIWAIGNPQFKESFYKAGKSLTETDLKFDTAEEYKDVLRGNVDLWSYYEKNIPVIMLSSGGFPEHHTLQDKINLIDFEHLHKAAVLLYSLIMEMGNGQQLNDNIKTNFADK
ncbi:MAG: M28 family peptidase, partial [Bacteroidales bacterium]